MGPDPLLAGVVGAVLGFALGLLLSYGTFLGRRYLKAVGKHKLLLIATLRRDLPADHLANYDGDRLFFPQLDWGNWDSPSTKILTHLSDPSYSQVQLALSAARQRYSLHAATMETERAKFEDRINAKIGEPKGMVVWKGNYPGPRPWYALATIRKVLFEDYRNRLGGGYFDPLELAIEPNPARSWVGSESQLSFNRIQIAIGSETQMAALEERIRPLLTDEFLRACVRLVDSADKARINEPAKKAFDDERGLLLERLVLRSEAVRAKCPLCPRFLRIHPIDELPG